MLSRSVVTVSRAVRSDAMANTHRCTNEGTRSTLGIRSARASPTSQWTLRSSADRLCSSPISASSSAWATPR
jgi:hypothetical protein